MNVKDKNAKDKKEEHRVDTGARELLPEMQCGREQFIHGPRKVLVAVCVNRFPWKGRLQDVICIPFSLITVDQKHLADDQRLSIKLLNENTF